MISMGLKFLMLQYLLLLLHIGRSESLTQPSSMPPPECSMPVNHCTEMSEGSMCIGTKLPYSHTAIVLAEDSANLTDVHDNLALWSGLRNVPRCWEVVQPLLCSVYLPKCETVGNQSFIHLTPWEFCNITRGPCKIVTTTKGWPSFLQCNQSHFARGCNSEIKSVKFNTTGTCELPLVPTNNRHSWYKDVDGCGVQCRNPLFTDAEHHRMHVFIAVFGALCMACTLFAVLTFLIDWKNSSRYPALILFFINACFFIGSVGWMAQFVPGAWQDIVCRSDGTMRIAEPQISSGETASCSVVFVLVYYFMIAGVTWFVILTYCWHLMFRSLQSPIDVIEGKRGSFHVFAWSVPLVLTIVCLAVTQIDGDSVTGICFVGYMEHGYRAGFLLAPIALVIIIGLTFMVMGLITLVKIKINSPGLMSERASTKIRDTIIRLGVFASLALAFALVTFSVHLYIFTNERRWKKSFADYIFCEANINLMAESKNTTCIMDDRPSLGAMQVHVFAYFGAGISMSSWVWNTSSMKTWKRFLRRCWGLPNNDPVKVQKHKVIAQAFSKRRELNQGRLSLSFNSTHDDPMGMRFDLNSLSSHEVSSVWAAAIPRLVQRRGGVTQRRYSDSDVQSIQSMVDQISGIMSDSDARVPSIHSHGSSGHEEKNVPRPEKKRRRKRRKRGMNRVTPAMTAAPGALSTDPASTANSSRLGSTERVSSLGTGSRNSSSLASASEPVRCDSASSSASLQNATGQVNIAYETTEHEAELSVNRVFQLKSSPNSAFEPYHRSDSPEIQSSPSLSLHTVSIASSDTDAMSIKDFTPLQIESPKQTHSASPVVITHKLSGRQPEVDCEIHMDDREPRAPLMFSRHLHQVPTSLHQPLPYHIPVPPPQYTAFHSHTMYSMMHPAPPYLGYPYPNPIYHLQHKMPDIDAPILPIGAPVPPVAIKRRPHACHKEKSHPPLSPHDRAPSPRTNKPQPTILNIGALPGAVDDIEFVTSRYSESTRRTTLRASLPVKSPSLRANPLTQRNLDTDPELTKIGRRRRKNRIGMDPNAVMLISGNDVAESSF